MRPITMISHSKTVYLDYHKSHYSVILDDIVIGRVDIINSHMFRANGNMYDRLYMAVRDLVRRKVGEG